MKIEDCMASAGMEIMHVDPSRILMRRCGMLLPSCHMLPP